MAVAVTWPLETDLRMGRVEAEEITQAIKENFDSLGSMLMQARDKKAYKALGYNSFSAYCKTEFGKSMSTAYQAIEDARVVAQLEAEISKQYTEPVTLKIQPSSLRPLKNLSEIGDKLRAIEYAQRLAETEGKKKPTKKHLEIATLQIGGKRNEEAKSAIESLGFTKGVEVELTKSLRQDRGFITKVDKRGIVYVELYNGGATPIICDDISALRILSPAEKPAIPTSDNTVNKGDKVRIFAKGLEGKTGEIYTWKMGKYATVLIEGDEAPIAIAYAELEIIDTPRKDCNWESELVWDSGKSTYYYFPKEDKIYSNRWPTGLTLTPSTFYAQSCHTENPIEFIKKWEEEFAGKILESFATHSRIKTLILAQAIQLPEEEKREFVTDLIANLTQILPYQDREKLEANKTQTKAAGISFSKTINELVSGKKTQTRRAWKEDYAKIFIRYFEEGIKIPALNKGRHRGGGELGYIRLTQRPYQQYLSQMTPTDLQEEGGMVSTPQEFIDNFFDGKDQLIWVLHFKFEASVNAADVDAEILKAENQRLREQLAEAEFAIETMVNTAHKFEFETSVNDADVDGEVIEAEDQTSTLLGSLREQLAETRSAIETMVSTAHGQADTEQIAEFTVEDAASTASVADIEQTTDFLAENISEISAPTDTAAHPDSWKQLPDVQTVESPIEAVLIDTWTDLLEGNGFTKQDEAHQDEEPTETYRGWDIYAHNTSVASISHTSKGNFSINLSGSKKQILRPFKWLKDIISQIEGFRPTEEFFPQDMTNRVTSERQKIFQSIEDIEARKVPSVKKKEAIERNKRDLEALQLKLETLKKFEQLSIGQTVWRKSNPETSGTITGFTFTTGGMPHAFVQWHSEYEDPSLFSPITSPEIVSAILVARPVAVC